MGSFLRRGKLLGLRLDPLAQAAVLLQREDLGFRLRQLRLDLLVRQLSRLRDGRRGCGDSRLIVIGGVVPAGAVGGVRGRAGVGDGILAGGGEGTADVGGIGLEIVSKLEVHHFQRGKCTVRSVTAEWRLGVAATGAEGWLSVIQVTRIFLS
jgi:hypothetical protein